MQSPELNQKAIDVLSMTSSVLSIAKNQRVVIPIKLGSTNSVTSAQMQELTALAQMFARGIGFRFSAWLGCVTKLNLVSVERILFTEFLVSVSPEDTYIASWMMEPVNAPCLAYMDIAFVNPLIDLLLGGTGSMLLRRQPSDITDIEAAILDSVMVEMCTELSSALKSAGISMRHQKRLLSSHHGQAVPARDNTLCLTFEMEVGQTQGSLQLLLSGVASDTLLRALNLENIKRAPSPSAKQRLREKARKFRYGVSLQLPIASVSARALNELRPGAVLPLQVSTETPAVLAVAGVPLFDAQPVAAAPRRAAYVIQLRPPSPRLSRTHHGEITPSGENSTAPQTSTGS